jgi:hypothetical protein
MNSVEWNEFWSSNLKFKDQAPIDHLIEGLAKADLVSL